MEQTYRLQVLAVEGQTPTVNLKQIYIRPEEGGEITAGTVNTLVSPE